MSDTPTPLPANPSLEQLRKQAKDRLRELRATNESATLADAQFTVARQYGFETWAKLKHHIETLRPTQIERFEKLADELAAGYESGDEGIVRAINANYGTSFATDFHDPDKVRAHGRAVNARQMVAHAYGFENWEAFAAKVTQTPFYEIDREENSLSVRGPQTQQDWNEIFAVIEENGISKLELGGISDEAMRGLSRIECVTHLNVSGSKMLTDEGAQHLARMPQLVELEIGGWHTTLTDRAFVPLRHLKELRSLRACWTRGLTDAGAENFAACDRLETVNVMGSGAGDGLIRALAGKTSLRFLDTGRTVTDAGIPELRQIPVFGNWLGGEVRTGLLGKAKLPNRLMIDGDFTDAGLKGLEGLEGVAGLSFFWHSKTFTADGLGVLRGLPHLEVFGIDGDQCGDDALGQIAAVPRLRQLQAQGAVAGDAGWQSLARAQMLEYIWGRECPNFSSRGFEALASLPALRGIGISCKLVDDASLSLLPRFPALRMFIPIDVGDDGFRHVGRCAHLESLICMYCRDTGDTATENIRGLSNLRTYYAGMTQITDRSLEILGRMPSLEKLEFWQCMALTGDGFSHLARLPRLREVEVHGSPHVSRKIAGLFREHVRVRYSG